MTPGNAVVAICEYVERPVFEMGYDFVRISPDKLRQLLNEWIDPERASTLLCQDVLDELVWNESLFNVRKTPHVFREKLLQLLNDTKKGIGTSEGFDRSLLQLRAEQLVRDLTLWARGRMHAVQNL